MELAIFISRIAFHEAASTETPMPIFFSVTGSIAFFLPPCCTAILKDLSLPPSREKLGEFSLWSKGASIYDFRSGWGKGVPKKQTKEQNQLICDSDKVGRG